MKHTATTDRIILRQRPMKSVIATTEMGNLVLPDSHVASVRKEQTKIRPATVVSIGPALMPDQIGFEEGDKVWYMAERAIPIDGYYDKNFGNTEADGWDSFVMGEYVTCGVESICSREAE